MGAKAPRAPGDENTCFGELVTAKAPKSERSRKGLLIPGLQQLRRDKLNAKAPEQTTPS